MATDEKLRPAWISAHLGSRALGSSVDLRFSDKTVLVGRNGAGKSAVLEALQASRSSVFGAGLSALEGEGSDFSCVLRGDDGRYFQFNHERTLQLPEDEPTAAAADEEEALKLNYRVLESCNSGDEVLWRTENGVTRGSLIDGEQITPPAVGWLASSRTNPFGIRSLLLGTRLVGAGPARTGHFRQSVFVSKSRRPRVGLNRVAVALINLKETQEDAFAEFADLTRQLGLASDVRVVSFSTQEDSEEFEAVLFDRVNLGLLSDGTLRVVDILLAVVSRPSLLMLEEPENSLHPALLKRLLNVLDAYSSESQLVVTTQSPQVVSWALPSELRLVERRARRGGAHRSSETRVREISNDESERLSDYLSNDATLGEFVYSGGMEDDGDWDLG